jgi:hypothetical protein
MVAQNADPPGAALESREPSLADLVELCRQLNARGARHVVIDGAKDAADLRFLALLFEQAGETPPAD